MIIVLYQNPAFPTIQSTRWPETSNLLIPKPATIASFFIGDSFHQARILTAHAKQRCQDESQNRKVNVRHPNRLFRFSNSEQNRTEKNKNKPSVNVELNQILKLIFLAHENQQKIFSTDESHDQSIEGTTINLNITSEPQPIFALTSGESSEIMTKYATAPDTANIKGNVTKVQNGQQGPAMTMGVPSVRSHNTNIFPKRRAQQHQYRWKSLRGPCSATSRSHRVDTANLGIMHHRSNY